MQQIKPKPNPSPDRACAPTPIGQCAPHTRDTTFTPQSTPTSQSTNALGNHIDLDDLSVLGNGHLLDLLKGTTLGGSVGEGAAAGGSALGAAAARAFPTVRRE